MGGYIDIYIFKRNQFIILCFCTCQKGVCFCAITQSMTIYEIQSSIFLTDKFDIKKMKKQQVIFYDTVYNIVKPYQIDVNKMRLSIIIIDR